jgi:hypothetical protein
LPGQRRKRTTAPSLDFISFSLVVAISLDTMEPPPPLLHFVALFKSRKIARLPRLQLDHIRSTGRSESLAPPRLPHKLCWLLLILIGQHTVGWTTGMSFLSLSSEILFGPFCLVRKLAYHLGF